jgi:hypothetical protein
VLLERDTGLPHFLAPNLLTEEKGVNPVIHDDVVLNNPQDRSTLLSPDHSLSVTRSRTDMPFHRWRIFYGCKKLEM